jgi:hypothetical protein
MVLQHRHARARRARCQQPRPSGEKHDVNGWNAWALVLTGRRSAVRRQASFVI